MGKTVGELLTGEAAPMKAVEFMLWSEYRSKYGYKTDRLEWAVANGASALCYAWGAKVKAEDIVPKFGREEPSRRATLLKLATLPGAVVIFTPNDPSKPTLTGAAAIEKIDEVDRKRVDRRLLDDGGERTKPERRPTIGGD